MQKLSDYVPDQFGNVVPFPSIAVFNAGTQTPATIYSDNGVNPIVGGAFTGDQYGRYAFYGSGRFDVVISSAKIVTYTLPDIVLQDSAPAITAVSAALAASSGSSLVGFIQSGTGAVARTVQAKERDIVSVKDFGTIGNGVAADTAAVQLAIASGAKTIVGVQGETYLLGAGGLQFASLTGVKFIGNGATLKFNAAATQTVTGGGSSMILMTSCTNCSVEGWVVDGNSKATNFVGLNSCTDCSVSNNYVSSGGVNALIFGTNNTRSRYNFNVLTTTTGTSRGIWAGNYNTSQMDSDVEIIGNNITGLPATGIIAASVGGRVIGNHVSGLTAGSGIIFGGANGFSSKYLSIIGNTCRSNNFHGIQSDVTYSTIADVPVGIAITSNICELNLGDGIFAIYMNGGTISGNVGINNNSDAVGSGHGINVDEASELAITGNYCCDTRAGGARTQTNGINIIAAIGTNNIKNLTVSGNICRNNQASGIVAQSNSTFTIAGLSITGNQCNDNASRGIQISEATAGKVTRIAVVGNVCSGNTTDDLRVDPLDAAINDNQYTNDASGNTRFFTFADLAATPSVLGARNMFKCANSGATTITNFANGVNGQQIEVDFTTANTTINNGGNFVLKGALNVAPVPANAFMRFFWNGVWLENGRNF